MSATAVADQSAIDKLFSECPEAFEDGIVVESQTVTTHDKQSDGRIMVRTRESSMRLDFNKATGLWKVSGRKKEMSHGIGEIGEFKKGEPVSDKSIERVLGKTEFTTEELPRLFNQFRLNIIASVPNGKSISSPSGYPSGQKGVRAEDVKNILQPLGFSF